MKKTSFAFLIGVLVGALGLSWFSPNTKIDIRIDSSNGPGGASAAVALPGHLDICPPAAQDARRRNV